MIQAKDVITEAKKKANKEKTAILGRFFKTGPGQYGAGDVFWGLTVPQSRTIAKKYSDLSLIEIKKLLESPVHEIRLIALLILVEQFTKGDVLKQRAITNFYLKNTKYINNWDLVDLSASKILGSWLIDKDTAILYKLIKSDNLWERRIAIVATYAFIKADSFKHTLSLAEKLLNDKHDLMHKAAGWMLREMGKRSINDLKVFLKNYTRRMPRTMLRYAIEKFPEIERQKYLKK
ncbi:MAG: DNA alkylation repair protein [Candidatus Falkowbacteria bacterium]|nr:DNA alkylation repair protein [Candidatus Falkowbacteria bacterium]